LDTGDSPVLSIGQIAWTVKYYANGLYVVSTPENRCDIDSSEDPMIKKSSNASKKVWVIAGRDWNRRAIACLDELAPSYAILKHERFTGTDIWLLGRRE
jgi:hypothetical protein